MANLTPKQKAFADEYIINGGNATQAAIKAGYSKKTAEATASRLLRNVKVVEYIASRVKTVLEKREVDVQEQLNRLLDIYNGEIVESRSKQIDHLKKGKVTKNMTYQYTPDLDSRLKAIDLFFKYGSPLLQAQLEKTQAEAELAKAKVEQIKDADTAKSENIVIIDEWSDSNE